ncbi:MAG: hypothetical protein KDA96_03910 [Planctomycetaceae bacterium]|nr:hypothetical protein [Planctomycetaceae bacterium]
MVRNALQNPAFAHDDPRSAGALFAAGSPWRVRLTGLVLICCLAIIFVRVCDVKTRLPEQYLTALRATTTEYEFLPSRDGRIVTNTVVLAADVDQYAVELHYRWLQHPVDETWLRSQVRSRLNRSERSDNALVEKVREDILSERTLLLKELAMVAEVPDGQITSQCQRVQSRVQRIADSVNRRHRTNQEHGDWLQASNTGNWLMNLAGSVRDALSTPPRRTTTERIVVREEESWHVVLDDVPLRVATMISEHPERFPGTRILQSSRRSYPEGHLAAHLVGARKPNSDEPDLPVVSGARIPVPEPMRSGLSGVERSYTEQLSGQPGVRRIVRDRRQRIISSEIVREPRSGQDVVLTIDAPLQKLCEQLLAEAMYDAPRLLLDASSPEDAGANAGPEEREETEPGQPQPIPVGGSIVVMEAATGRVVAAASAPSFDLQLFTGGTAEQWDRVNQDQRFPFVFRVTGMALPPGSTFKILTAMAALETGTITPDRPFFCQGYLNQPDQHRCLIYRLYGNGHQNIRLKDALAQSCNVYFFDAAQRMGIQPLAEWSQRLEFGQPTNVDLPFETAGSVPPSPLSETQQTATATQDLNRRFRSETLGWAIGQSRLTVTPLQMARLTAAIANGGWLVSPHVVSQEGTSRRAVEEAATDRSAQRTRIPGVQPQTLQAIHAGLVAAIQNPAGTGYRDVRLNSLPIAGKTGTAETAPSKPDHAWFVGYAPADDPEYVVVVTLEHGGSGSHAAGPVAREVFRGLQQFNLIEGLQKP